MILFSAKITVSIILDHVPKKNSITSIFARIYEKEI